MSTPAVTINKPIHCPEKIRWVIRELQRNGHQAVLAGGCVRDVLLEKTPADWDVATSALPDEVERIFPRTVAVGKQFGIIVVVLPDGDNCEVATFRGESEYTDGRHPGKISFVGMAEDVQRRDFTINALLADPEKGEIYDFVGGIADLKAGILRAVGDPAVRFEEDKLRVMRAVRFAARLHFQIHPETQRAMQLATPKLKECLSSERIAAEIDKMLLDGASKVAMAMLAECGILAAVLPELAACQGVEQPPQFHPEGDVWQHELKLLGEWDETRRRCRQWREKSPRPAVNGEGESLPPSREEVAQWTFDEEGRLQWAEEEQLRQLAWAALLHDVGKPPTFDDSTDRIRFNGHDVVGADMTQQILRHLKLPNTLINAAQWLVRNHMNCVTMPKMRLCRRRRMLQEPLMPLLLELLRLDTYASFGEMTLQKSLVEAWREEVATAPPPQLPINGRDLIQIGIKPGKHMGDLLARAADHNLEEPFPTREAALEWVKEEFARITSDVSSHKTPAADEDVDVCEKA